MSPEDMIVRSFRTYHLTIPLARRLISGIHDFSTTENVVLELDVGDVVGLGHAYAFTPWQADAIRAMVIDLAGALVGRDVSAIRGVWAELWNRINFIGHAGPPVMALAAVDTALWDIHGKTAELPLYKMLGAVRNEVPVYATGGWFTYSKEELVEECLRFFELGYRDYKMKVGHQDWQIDIERVEHVASRIGQYPIRLMVDANQAWSVEQAIPAGRALKELGVVWFEEPVVVQDIDACARIAAEVDIPLATGESLFTRHGFRPWIERRAADVLMPDLMRCGGPTEFIHVAQMAEDQRIPISSHTFTEQSSHLIAASANGLSVEIVPGWFDGLFDAAPKVSDGKMRLSDGPGLGVSLSERAVAEYSSEAARASAVRI